jgi:hypothetical protein
MSNGNTGDVYASKLLVQLLQKLADTALHFVNPFPDVRVTWLCIGVLVSFDASFMLARTIDLLVHVVCHGMGVGRWHLPTGAAILELTITTGRRRSHGLIGLRREAR